MLAKRAEKAARAEAEQAEAEQEAKEAAARDRAAAKSKPRASRRQGVGEACLKSAVRSIGTSIGSKLVRGILGSLLK